MRLFGLVVVFVAALQGAAVASTGSAFDPTGTWHVLVHYREPESSHPERWHWRDEVWTIEHVGDRLRWTRYPIVSFKDTTRRFENLGTNRARRMIGAWEPNGLQRNELSNGIQVRERGSRNHLLESPRPLLWESAPGALMASAGMRMVNYREAWQISLDSSSGPSFELRDSVGSSGPSTAPEEGGFERYAALSVRDDGTLVEGRYERDGRLFGRFRLSATRILEPDVVDGTTEIEMQPDSLIRGEVPVLVAALRPTHYFAARTLEVETTPPAAEVDVVYLRRGTQLMYRTARTPAMIELPTRFQADAEDVLRVRAALAGYEQATKIVPIRGEQEKLHFELKPLASRLAAVAHTHLLDRTVLQLRTTERPSMFVHPAASSVQIALSRTALEAGAAEGLAELSDRNVVRAEAVQAGEDLLVYLELAEGVDGTTLSIRRLEGPQLPGGDAWTAVELSRPAEAEVRIGQTLAALDGITSSVMSRCPLEFDSALRNELGEQELSLAMAPAGRIVGPTLRAAMRRLVAIAPDGIVRFEDGTSVSVTSDLELEFALARSGEVRGYLGLIRALVAALEPPALHASALRGLIAPRIRADRFDAVLARADTAQAGCRLASAR